MKLWRPMGQKELDLIAQSDWMAFPPRLPDQPIFILYVILTMRPRLPVTGIQRGRTTDILATSLNSALTTSTHNSLTFRLSAIATIRNCGSLLRSSSASIPTSSARSLLSQPSRTAS